MAIRCYQHEERPLVAWCHQCARPCCRDCCLEMFDRYYCERCKNAVADELQKDAVQPDAMRAPIIAIAGLFIAGFLLGPYALWRANMARQQLQVRPWMRGRWQIYATFVIAGIATVQGVAILVGRMLAGGG